MVDGVLQFGSGWSITADYSTAVSKVDKAWGTVQETVTRGRSFFRDSGSTDPANRFNVTGGFVTGEYTTTSINDENWGIMESQLTEGISYEKTSAKLENGVMSYAEKDAESNFVRVGGELVYAQGVHKRHLQDVCK